MYTRTTRVAIFEVFVLRHYTCSLICSSGQPVVIKTFPTSKCLRKNRINTNMNIDIERHYPWTNAYQRQSKFLRVELFMPNMKGFGMCRGYRFLRIPDRTGQ